MQQRSHMIPDQKVDHYRIPKQPSTAVSYWNVGILLHFSVILFIIESWFYWTKLKNAYTSEASF
ncbi:MAG TPA: hypothetical protein VGC08_02820, partial [Pedobacter sp.]